MLLYCTLILLSISDLKIEYTTSAQGNLILVVNGYKFLKQKMSKNRVYWRCHRYKPLNCQARVSQNTTTNRLELNAQPHNHAISGSRPKTGEL